MMALGKIEKKMSHQEHQVKTHIFRLRHMTIKTNLFSLDLIKSDIVCRF